MKDNEKNDFMGSMIMKNNEKNDFYSSLFVISVSLFLSSFFITLYLYYHN